LPDVSTYSRAFEHVLPAAAKESLNQLDFFARRTVEGFLHGVHSSRRKGVSTEFDHHTQYQPGDPLKHVDWKVSARHDQYVVKRYQEDTSLAVRLIVDRSGSMRRSTGGPTKYDHACKLAACLAYLALNQGDSVGLTVTSEAKTDWLPPRSAPTHLVVLLRALVSQEAAAPDAVTHCLRAILDRGERRGLVVLVSDLMFPPEDTRRELGRLQAQGHEVLLMQVRDPAEEDFPFRRWITFDDLEGAGRRRIDTVPLRRLYREEYAALRTEWQEWARKYDIHLVSLRTDQHVDAVLSEYISRRAGAQ